MEDPIYILTHIIMFCCAILILGIVLTEISWFKSHKDHSLTNLMKRIINIAARFFA